MRSLLRAWRKCLIHTKSPTMQIFRFFAWTNNRFSWSRKQGLQSSQRLITVNEWTTSTSVLEQPTSLCSPNLWRVGERLPCGFIGEVFVTLSVWNYSIVLAILSASVVVLTASYILWVVQRVYLGPEYRGPHGDSLTRMNVREISIAAPLVALAILFGVYPRTVLRYTTPSVDKTVEELAAWTERHYNGQPAVGEGQEVASGRGAWKPESQPVALADGVEQPRATP